jgi:tRNA G10  N-methylase Trm11
MDHFEEDIDYSDKNILWSIYALDSPKSLAEELKIKVTSLIKLKHKKSIYVGSPPGFSEKGGISVSRALIKGLSAKGYEFIIATSDGELSVWRTVRHLDLRGFRQRDLTRPFKNPLISIPPWLARTMINLAALPKGSRLLDPFCGTGTILIEAAYSGHRVYGMDMDPANVAGSIANMKWLSNKIGIAPPPIIRGDSRNLSEHFQQNYFDAVVTEPPFGPPFNSTPSIHEVEIIADELSGLYKSVLKSVSSVLKPKGKLVITFPTWKTKAGTTYQMDAESVFKYTGLELQKTVGKVSLPIRWSKPDNVIQRLIYLATKRAP